MHGANSGAGEVLRTVGLLLNFAAVIAFALFLSTLGGPASNRSCHTWMPTGISSSASPALVRQRVRPGFRARGAKGTLVSRANPVVSRSTPSNAESPAAIAQR